MGVDEGGREGGVTFPPPQPPIKKFRSGIGTGVFFEEGKVKRWERIFGIQVPLSIKVRGGGALGKRLRARRAILRI